MITSSSYFTGIIEVPNISTANTPNASRVGKQTKLARFIEEYELDVISKCLGAYLSKEFQSKLEVVSPATVQTVKSSAEQKWKDLFNGKEYSLNGQPVEWRGLIFKQGTVDISLISYYVFMQFFRHDMTRFGDIGLQIEKAKNAKRAFYGPKYVLAGQKFYELTVGNSNDIYKTSGYRSLYQFIQDMNDIDPTTFPNWMPYSFPKINIMGL